MLRGTGRRGRGYAGNDYPGWEELAWVFAAAGEVEDPGGYVGVYRVYREEADEGCLWGVMDEPGRG